MAKKTTHRKPVKILKKKPVKAPSKSKSTSKKKQVEVKAPTEPLFNVQEHVLVSKHEVLNQEQVEQLFMDIKVAPQHLPVIFVSDPAISGLEIKMGDIIKITRPSATAGTAIYYRRVAYE